HRRETRDGDYRRRRGGARPDIERRERTVAWKSRRSRHRPHHPCELQGVPGPVTVPTPLLDLFKRGEVDRDVRMLAAQGGLATRAPEQLGILVVLLEDRDPEVR